jgi:MoaA/NifB/PqqE/SkfB family radical SAM enzyme
MRCLSIHLTDLCNSKCTFCVVASPLYRRDSIDYRDVVEFLKANAGRGYEAVNLHGGEATIHPRFLETLALIIQLGYREIHLQTNAISLSNVDFARQVIANGVSLFIISLHGDTAQLHDSQTHSGGGFERTVQGIRNVKSGGARVRTNTVVTRQNVERLLAISQLACELGVDHINFSNLHPVGSALFARERIMPSFEEIRPQLTAASDYALQQRRRVTLEGFPFCTVGHLTHLHLNNQYREIRMLMRGHVIDNYDDFMSDKCRTLGPPCQGCSARDDCGGVYPEYVELRGWSEFIPITSALPREVVSPA